MTIPTPRDYEPGEIVRSDLVGIDVPVTPIFDQVLEESRGPGFGQLSFDFDPEAPNASNDPVANDS